MKNIYEVLRQKEQQSEQLRKEIDALRLTIKILDAAEAPATPAKAEAGTNGNGSQHHESSALAAASPSKRFP